MRHNINCVGGLNEKAVKNIEHKSQCIDIHTLNKDLEAIIITEERPVITKEEIHLSSNSHAQSQSISSKKTERGGVVKYTVKWEHLIHLHTTCWNTCNLIFQEISTTKLCFMKRMEMGRSQITKVVQMCIILKGQKTFTNIDHTLDSKGTFNKFL